MNKTYTSSKKDLTSFRPKILLLGAGYVLSYVAKHLDFSEFIATSRNNEKLIEFEKSGIVGRKFDRSADSNINSILEEFPSIDILIDSIPPSKNKNEMDEYFKSLQELSLKKIIYLSTTGVYGVTDGSWVFEDTPVNPLYEPSKLRVESEYLYFDNFDNVTVLRIPAIQGPGREGIKDSILNGTFKIVKNDHKWLNKIDVKDLSRIILKVVKKELNQRILNCTDGNPLLLADEIRSLCAEHNVPYPEIISLEKAIELHMYSRLLNQRIGTIHKGFLPITP